MKPITIIPICLWIGFVVAVSSCNDNEDDQNLNDPISLYEMNKTIIEINTTNFATGLETFYQIDLTDSTDRARLCVALVQPARFFEDQTGYFFVETFDAWMILDAAKPELSGTYRMDVQDAHGKYYVREMVETVKYAGYGFVEYYFDNPLSGKTERKLSFAKSIPSALWFIGSGFYGEPENIYVERFEAEKIIVREATRAMATGIGGVLANYCTDSIDGIDFCRKFVDHIRFFDDQSGYFFIYDFNRINIAFPTQKYLQGEDLSDYQDSRGNYVIRDLAEIASSYGEGYYEYYWNNPINSQEEKKLSFVMKIPGINYFIGAGFYSSEETND
jgi:signal transduction histidine kinase